MTTEYQDERRQIEEHVSGNFTLTPVAYPNSPFNERGQSEFVRLIIRSGRAFPKSFGGSQLAVEKSGQVVFSIHVKKHTGTNRTYEIADAINTLFFTQQIGEMDFSEFEMGSSSERDEWYVTNFITYYTWKKCM